MTSQEKAEFLIEGYNNFWNIVDAEVVKNPQSQLRIVALDENPNITTTIVDFYNTFEMEEIVSIFVKELSLKDYDYTLQDYRAFMGSGYLYLQHLKIEVFNI